MRIEFICIIWTVSFILTSYFSSWGLNLFVLFEHKYTYRGVSYGSWGLNLFVLFEHYIDGKARMVRSWGLNLFVLFEQIESRHWLAIVLEDWIYLYYLNSGSEIYGKEKFLRIEFICIIWTFLDMHLSLSSSWGLNLFVLFEPWKYDMESHNVLEDWIYLYYLN